MIVSTAMHDAHAQPAFHGHQKYALIEANASGGQSEIGADAKGPTRLIGSALICWIAAARRGLDTAVPIRECVAQLLRTRSDASTCNSTRSAEIRCIVAVRSSCASNEP